MIAFLARRERLHYTQKEMADFLGVSQRSIAAWESGETEPHPRKLRDIAQRLRVPSSYFTGASVPEDSSEISTSQLIEPTNDGKIVRVEKHPVRLVPVVSWAKAGAALNYDDLCNQIEERVETTCRDPNAFALIIEGDSMEPRFHAGDRAVFAPNSEPRNGDFVVARKRDDGGVLFKRYRRIGPEGATIRLENLNPAFKVLEFPVTVFHFIYPAIEVKVTLRHQ